MKKQYILAAGIIIPLIIFSVIKISNRTESDKSIQISRDPVQKWARIFDPSVLTYEERVEELQWFKDAARELGNVQIISTAENIETHYWESRVLAVAFKEITGIDVSHVIIPEGELVPKLTNQLENKIWFADIYVNDADMIGYHLRTQNIVNLTHYMKKEGQSYTNPYLDLQDFLNLEFGQNYDGDQLQLPDQQFATLYWFRYDWFTRADIKNKFKARYGYPLGVPVNWAAYEDIAEFFTSTPIDGKKVYGHVDYGKPGPSLGWRFTDAWFSIAGVGDKGLPNGIPVDEWGIRVEGRIPVGSSVSRGGEVNGPAAIYALDTYLKWLKFYAPPEAYNWEWTDAGPICSRGDIAQNIFQYITWLSDLRFHTPGSPVCNRSGKPLWRVAPIPHGRYWDEGMKVGYQDAGCWTIPKSTTDKKLAAAWLWAQFCVSKTADLKKFLASGTPIRKSTIFSSYLSNHIDEYGGLIEFYRSPEEKKYTGSGRNVPDYPTMSQFWWKNISKAIKNELTPEESLNKLAEEQDTCMLNLSQREYSPILNKKIPPSEWLNKKEKKPSDSPKNFRPREKPVTVPYDDLIKLWED